MCIDLGQHDGVHNTPMSAPLPVHQLFSDLLYNRVCIQ